MKRRTKLADKLDKAIDIDNEGNIEAGKDLKIDGKITSSSIVDRKNFTGDFDNRFTIGSDSYNIIPDSDSVTTEEWQWVVRKNKEALKDSMAFTEIVQSQPGDRRHQFKIRETFDITFTSTATYSATQKISLVVGYVPNNNSHLASLRTADRKLYSSFSAYGVAFMRSGDICLPCDFELDSQNRIRISAISTAGITIPAKQEIRFTGYVVVWPY